MLPPECLSLLSPTPEETDLIRACLWSGTRARDAWARWRQSVGDVGRAIAENVSGVKSLLPLLQHGLRRSGSDIEAPVRSALAAAALTETLRWEMYAASCTRAFAALSTASVPFLALKGAALAVSVYPEQTLRHSHDIDVLVRSGDLDRACATLRSGGFTQPQRRNRIDGQGVRLLDASGLPIELHDRLFHSPYYTPPRADVWTRARRCEVAGLGVPTLCGADHLLYVCGQAACCASRDSLKWVADAWYLIARGDGGLDWEVLLRAAGESRLALPLAVLLGFLTDQLEAPVPGFALERLASAAATADRAAREVALSGLRAGKRGTFRNLFRATRSWRGRAELARWMVLPSPTSLRLGTPLRYPRAWPVYYVARPLLYATRRLCNAAGIG